MPRLFQNIHFRQKGTIVGMFFELYYPLAVYYPFGSGLEGEKPGSRRRSKTCSTISSRRPTC